MALQELMCQIKKLNNDLQVKDKERQYIICELKALEKDIAKIKV
jgi:hypothetical protein